jgi:hypothetical protein
MVMPSELARNMNKKSIRLVFEDPSASINGMSVDPWIPYSRVVSIVDSSSIKTGSYKKRIRISGEENLETGSIQIPHSPSTINSNSNNGRESASVSSQSPYLQAAVQSTGNKSKTSVHPEVIVINDDTSKEMEDLKKTVHNMEIPSAQMTTLEKDIRNVAQGVVCMGDNMVLNNEILKRNITSDIKTNIEQTTIRNNEALIVSMSKLMSEQTAQIETRMDTKWEQNDKMYELLQETLDNKLEKTTRNLKKLLDTTDNSRKIITKHQSKTRASRSLSRFNSELLDDSMDASLFDKENDVRTICSVTHWGDTGIVLV